MRNKPPQSPHPPRSTIHDPRSTIHPAKPTLNQSARANARAFNAKLAFHTLTPPTFTITPTLIAAHVRASTRIEHQKPNSNSV